MLKLSLNSSLCLGTVSSLQSILLKAPSVFLVLTHSARWRGRFASGQVSKRGDGGGVR